MEKVDFDVLWFLYIDIVWLFDNIIIVPVIVSGACYLENSELQFSLQWTRKGIRLKSSFS